MGWLIAWIGRTVQRLVAVLASPRLFSYALLWLMALVFFGTLAQREVGLYQAREDYLQSFWLFGGNLPLPGGLAVLSLIGVGLAARMLQPQHWQWRSAGTLLLHAAALVLLIGGLISLRFAQEGNLVLREGQTSSLIHSPELLELAVIAEDVEGADSGDVSEEWVTIFDEYWLRTGEFLRSPADFPFVLELWLAERNCRSTSRLPATESPWDGELEAIPRRGVAAELELLAAPPASEPTGNRACVVFHLQEAGDALDGLYAVYEFMIDTPVLQLDGKSYRIELRRRQERLPFTVELIDFEREFHPGTAIASDYRSTVQIIDGGLAFERTIAMNRPLRYRDYTLYQASFVEDEGRDGDVQTTVLAIVRNAGRLFPYFAGVLMSLGLLWHLFGRLPPLFARRSRAWWR